VREGFQVEMALQSLFKAPTVRGLSELIGEARAAEGSNMERIALLLNSLEETLIHLQPEGELSPFFCVHPASVYSYTKLAQCLGTERPFIGIQAYGSAIDADPSEQIEIMAEQYVDEIRAHQPEGPYFLGGWSIGGLIAFEMARRLRVLGQQVAFVGLLDSSLAVEGEDKPDDVTLLLSFAADMGLSMKNMDMSIAEFSQLTPDEALSEILRQGKQAEILIPEFEVAELAERYELFKNKVMAMMSYVPETNPTCATLFLASNNSETLRNQMSSRWQAVTAGEVETHMVPGSHYDMLREPHVGILAGQLKAAIEQAQASIDDIVSTAG
jgi:thioesterase domain-containing protein